MKSATVSSGFMPTEFTTFARLVIEIDFERDFRKYRAAM
jgi:hypothetical protein